MGHIYAYAKVMFSFSPFALLSLPTQSGKRGAEAHAARIVGIVIVVRAVRVNVVEVVVIVTGAEPPVRGRMLHAEYNLC